VWATALLEKDRGECPGEVREGVEEKGEGGGVREGGRGGGQALEGEESVHSRARPRQS